MQFDLVIKVSPFIGIGAGLVGLVGLAVWSRHQDRLASYKRNVENGPTVKSNPPKPRAAPSKPRVPAAHIEGYMGALVTLLVLASALFVILMNKTYDDSQQKWAFGAVGTILGYWLKK